MNQKSKMTHRPHQPNDWLLGLPALQMADGTWRFTESGPIDISEFIAYRETLLKESDPDYTVLEIVQDLIDAHIITEIALRRMKNEF